jgi:hypothetical protein
MLAHTFPELIIPDMGSSKIHRILRQRESQILGLQTLTGALATRD